MFSRGRGGAGRSACDNIQLCCTKRKRLWELRVRARSSKISLPIASLTPVSRTEHPRVPAPPREHC